MAERGGFEPPCPLRDKTLSRRPRYDHFGTSPGRRANLNLTVIARDSKTDASFLLVVPLSALPARPHEAARAFAEVGEELARRRLLKHAAFERASCVLTHVAMVVVDEMECPLELADDAAAEAATPDSDEIDADQRVAFHRQRERRHVTRYTRAAAEHRALANPAELVDEHSAAEKRVVADLGMTRQERCVGQHHMMADPDVVAHVGSDHQQTRVADFGECARPGAAVNRCMLSNHRSRTDSHT
jgi:hypothetical protein